MDRQTLASYIDNTLLKPNVRPDQVEKFYAEARKNGFASVFVNSVWTPISSKILERSNTKIGCSVGFPLGASTPEMKAFETAQCLDNGANEVDMVMNIGAFLAGDFDFVKRDIEAVRNVITNKYGPGKDRPLLKVILEICYLSTEQIFKASQLVMEAGANFVKTSTGFAESGATVEAVRIMRNAVGPDFGVKVAGGIRDLRTALAMIDAGANRIGTSGGVKILNELQ